MYLNEGKLANPTLPSLCMMRNTHLW